MTGHVPFDLTYFSFGVRLESVRGLFGVCSGSVRAPFGLHSGQFRTKIFWSPKFQHKVSIVTLREAKRGSAGVLVAKREAAGDTQSVQEMTM